MLAADGGAHADRDRDVRRRLGRATSRRPAGGRSPASSTPQAFARFASYDLSVIPLFILMGNFASQGGISKALFEFASVVMGRFRGGLAMAAVLASGAFGAICGSSVATAATITSVALPEMRRHGYSGRLATGTLAAGGTLGILIPPSVPLVIYAILAEQNIAKLFAAAMVPGIIAMLGYMVAIAIYVPLVPGQAPDRRRPAAPLTLHSLGGIAADRRSSSGVVFGGIYGGIVHADRRRRGRRRRHLRRRAGSKREITWAKFKHCFYATAESVGDDLPDLHRRRPDELGPRADAGAGAASPTSSRAGACRR